ncbi:TIGR04104 family putative zinc finger protein [Halalkalibacter urbisdiaboli]|uniref:TIGR04104 family putative zinc finger protein n=1 Tax=Halalkalibacter urbisdiaboli TaxID=1960589 RepID=UPI0013FDD8E2|nr:TIGR04104 family putative zinc finger protein [Halalkalibacter urbisdiaboli]
MGIQKCEICGQPFTWREIQKGVRWSYKPLECSRCQTRHSITIQTRLLLGAITGLIVLFVISYVSKVSFYLGMVLAVLLPLIVLLLFPYFAKYKANQQEKY